jgi:hypothetical protein
LIEALSHTFKSKETDRQCYFMVKGMLSRLDGEDTVVFSYTSMDAFPPPIIPTSIMDLITEWIAEKGARTLVILAVIFILFVISLNWAKVCFQRLSGSVLFPVRGTKAEDIVAGAVGDALEKSDPKYKKVRNAVAESLSVIDDSLPVRNGPELAGLPSYRIIRAGVGAFLDSGTSNADIQAALENQLAVELKDLRTDCRVDWVWNTGYVEPLVGLFGTVTGLAFAFSSKVADRDTDMYAGIYEALYTTIAGLMSGIVLVLLYNFCDHRFSRVESDLQKLSTELAAQLRR